MITHDDISLAFKQFAPANKTANSITTLPLQKIAYIACNLMTLAVGLWKCQSMGLLPTGTGDWLAFETRGSVCFFILLVVSDTHDSSDLRHLKYHYFEGFLMFECYPTIYYSMILGSYFA